MVRHVRISHLRLVDIIAWNVRVSHHMTMHLGNIHQWTRYVGVMYLMARHVIVMHVLVRHDREYCCDNTSVVWTKHHLPFQRLVLDPRILLPFLPPWDYASRLPQLLQRASIDDTLMSSFTVMLPFCTLCILLAVLHGSKSLAIPDLPCLDSPWTDPSSSLSESRIFLRIFTR
jgi:hypothetical protein